MQQVLQGAPFQASVSMLEVCIATAVIQTLARRCQSLSDTPTELTKTSYESHFSCHNPGSIYVQLDDT